MWTKRFLFILAHFTENLNSDRWNNPVAVCQSKSRMENDNQAEQGRFTFNDIHRYLHDGRYPDGYTKSERLALRKRAKVFCPRGADLFYVGGASSKSLNCHLLS